MNYGDAVERMAFALERLHREGGAGIWSAKQVEAASGVPVAFQGRMVSMHAASMAIGREARTGVVPCHSAEGSLGWRTGAPLHRPNGGRWVYASECVKGLRTAELRGSAVCGLSGIITPAYRRTSADANLSEVVPSDGMLRDIWAWMGRLGGKTEVEEFGGVFKVTVIGRLVKGFALATAVLDAEERWWRHEKW